MSHNCTHFSLGQELTAEDVAFVCDHTKLDEESIHKWFVRFKEECPTGRLTKSHMHSLFKKVFPGGDAETFCNHIYRIFDSDGNGYLDFKVGSGTDHFILEVN